MFGNLLAKRKNKSKEKKWVLRIPGNFHDNLLQL